MGTFDFAIKLKNSHPEMLKSFDDFLMTVLLIANIVPQIQQLIPELRIRISRTLTKSFASLAFSFAKIIDDSRFVVTAS